MTIILRECWKVEHNETQGQRANTFLNSQQSSLHNHNRPLHQLSRQISSEGELLVAVQTSTHQQADVMASEIDAELLRLYN
jgi:hypothetical protein